MTNDNDARRAHDVLDGLFSGRILSRENEQLLRSFLPEMPKQKTLEEITAHVYDAWLASSDREFNGNEYDPGVAIEDWLLELHKHLKELKDISVAVPALPAGMRLADHEQYGRVVTSPKPDQDGVYVLLISTPKVETGADWEYTHECELTFIDAEPAKPARPEFLETEADYQDAPEGTIVAIGEESPRMKYENVWPAYVNSIARNCDLSGTRRRVLRLGWGE